MQSPGLVRRGGRGTLADGADVVWSIAEGARGRRWRAARIEDGCLRLALLLETDRPGRMTRLELSSAEGLLTLHPEPDESALHGNVVTPTGVRHLSFAWSPEHELFVDGMPIAAIAALPRLAGSLPPGTSRELPCVRVDGSLHVRAETMRLKRVDKRSWLLEGERIEVDDDGTPAGFAGPAEWPLEA